MSNINLFIILVILIGISWLLYIFKFWKLESVDEAQLLKDIIYFHNHYSVDSNLTIQYKVTRFDFFPSIISCVITMEASTVEIRVPILKYNRGILDVLLNKLRSYDLSMREVNLGPYIADLAIKSNASEEIEQIMKEIFVIMGVFRFKRVKRRIVGQKKADRR